MSRTDRPVLELPAVPSDVGVSVDALTLELALEPVTLSSTFGKDPLFFSFSLP